MRKCGHAVGCALGIQLTRQQFAQSVQGQQCRICRAASAQLCRYLGFALRTARQAARPTSSASVCAYSTGSRSGHYGVACRHYAFGPHTRRQTRVQLAQLGAQSHAHGGEPVNSHGGRYRRPLDHQFERLQVDIRAQGVALWAYCGQPQSGANQSVEFGQAGFRGQHGHLLRTGHGHTFLHLHFVHQLKLVELHVSHAQHRSFARQHRSTECRQQGLRILQAQLGFLCMQQLQGFLVDLAFAVVPRGSQPRLHRFANRRHQFSHDGLSTGRCLLNGGLVERCVLGRRHGHGNGPWLDGESNVYFSAL